MLREKLLKESVLDAVAKFIHETRRNTVAWTSDDIAKVIISIVEYHLDYIEREKCGGKCETDNE